MALNINSVTNNTLLVKSNSCEESQKVTETEQGVEPECNLESQLEHENPSSNQKMEWTTSYIKSLFAAYIKHRNKFDNIKFKSKQVWELISNELNKNHGIIVTGEQCTNKWKSMEKFYKKARDSNKAGRAKIRCPYYEEMDQILRNRRTFINPSSVVNLSDIDLVQTAISINPLNIHADSPESSPPNSEILSRQLLPGHQRILSTAQLKKHKEFNNYLMDYLKSKEERDERRLREKKKREEERRERHKSREYIEQRKLLLLEGLVKSFEAKV